MSLSIHHVSKSYGGRIALQDIDLTLERGIVGLLGANGSGKSTLLRLIATLDRPDKGEICWNDLRSSRDVRQMRGEIGYLPQELELPGHLTPQRLLSYLAQIRAVSLSSLDQLFFSLHLETIRHKRLSQLSAGQLRLVGIAQAILGTPRLLLLDELTHGLDIMECERIFRRLMRYDNVMIFSTHIPDDIERLAQTVIVLNKGQVMFHGTPDMLRGMARGSCYEVIVSHDTAQHLASQSTVSRLVPHDDKFKARVVGPPTSFDNAYPVEPSVEDAYLHLLALYKHE